MNTTHLVLGTAIGVTVGVWVSSTLLDELDAVDAPIPLVLSTLEQHDIDKAAGGPGPAGSGSARPKRIALR